MKIKITSSLSVPFILSLLLVFIALLLCPSVAHGAIRSSTNNTAITTPLITTMFFDQGTVYSPSIIVAFGPSGRPSKMRFTIQHPATGSLQDIYCVRPFLWVCTLVSDSSTIGRTVNVSGVIDPVSLEWQAQSLTFQ